MSNEIINQVEPQTVEYEVNGQSVKLSPNTIRKFLVRGNKDVNDQEIMMFLSLCKYQKLNPFLNEAYIVKFGNDAQIITGKEAFMKRAESHEQYRGFKAGIIVERNNEIVEIEGSVKLSKDILIGGWAEVYRDDREQPIKSRISFDEFNKSQSTWKQMPMVMIRKTAIVNALREAFPESLGAMYTPEEAETGGDSGAIQQEIKQNANKTLIDIPSEAQTVDFNKAEEIPKEPAPAKKEVKKEKAEPAPAIDIDEDELFND